MSTRLKISLEDLLDYIAESVYDYGHGLLAGSSWVIDAEPLLDHIHEKESIPKEELGRMYDEARLRVHGPNKVDPVTYEPKRG